MTNLPIAARPRYITSGLYRWTTADSFAGRETEYFDILDVPREALMGIMLGTMKFFRVQSLQDLMDYCPQAVCRDKEAKIALAFDVKEAIGLGILELIEERTF